MAIFPSTAIPSGAEAYTIDQSLRFDNDDTAYLTKTPAGAGNRRTWTYSAWVKTSSLAADGGNSGSIFEAYEDDGNRVRLYFDDGGGLNPLSFYCKLGSSLTMRLLTTQGFRDFSAWYHIVLAVDTTQGVDTNRVKLYVNGEQITSFSSSTYPSLNEEYAVNDTEVHHIGVGSYSGSLYGGTYFDGYLAEVHFIDGTQLTPTSFGEEGDYGEWKPIEVTGLTYGTNGFYLDFSDSAALGDDAAGSNDYAVTNLVASDQMVDSPTNNFCTMNPLSPNTTNLTFSEGNLKLAGWDIGFFGTMGVSSGKWYWEMHSTNASGNAYNTSAIGIVHSDALHDTADSSSNDGFQLFGGVNKGRGYYGYAGNKLDEDSNVSYGAAFVTGDIIGVALNLEDDEITFYKNNSSQGVAFTSLGSGDWFPLWQNWTSSVGVMNFGQDSSFAGIKTAQGNQDSNSIGDFYYTPPTDHLALCTSNLPEPAVIPSEHFNTVLHTGADAAVQAITGVGFQPDLLWIKGRSHAEGGNLFDAVRGGDKVLQVHNTATEETQASANITAFGADGFTMAADSHQYINYNAHTYVDWCWKANGSGSANTVGNIDSTVSVNTDAGFSIVSWTGDGEATGATVGHGLSKAPELILGKGREDEDHWRCYLPSGLEVQLNSTGTPYALSRWAAPTSTLIKPIGDGTGYMNISAEGFIAYCFHSVDGYSKFGSYTGNADADGTFVYLGFRPMFVVGRCNSAGSEWKMYDSKRNTYNVMDEEIRADRNDAASVHSNNYLDFLSNGFKPRYTDHVNQAQTYIYMAFAETPFKYSNAR